LLWLKKLHLNQKPFKINGTNCFIGNKKMKKNLLSVLTFGMFIVLFSSFALAQDSNKTVSSTSDLYVISAKAGGVNYVEGKVAVAGKNKRSGYLLKGDAVEVGDKVSTGTDGKAEILLNPGSYVRLAENSNFEFLTTSLDNLQLKLNEGSAMFEVIADDEFRIAVKTPKADFSIITSGVYRVSVLDNGSGQVAVWKGKAQIGDFYETEIKAGRTATVNVGQVAIEKFDRDEKDALEQWSKMRAKDLAKVNSRLQREDLRNSLISGFGSSQWNMYNSFGLWVFDRAFGSYCFLPFGYGWNSPYGYSYGRDLWYFRLPRVIYTQPPPSGGGTVASGKSRIRQITNSPMPYEKIQTTVERNKRSRTFDDSQFPSGSFPSSAPAPTVVSPPSKRVRSVGN
jgi:hypothetical protein